MKKKIIIANWKMNLSLKEVEYLTKDIEKKLKKIKGQLSQLDVVICPPFTVLSTVKKYSSIVKLGAQDVFWEEWGAYTGEISLTMLKEMGCQYIIVGHSERRKYLKETDEMVHRKVKLICDKAEGIVPIICVGETFDQRKAGQKDAVIIKQVSEALGGIKLSVQQQIIIAYEPVWVIGTGQAVEPTEAEYTHRVIRQKLIDLFPLPIIRNNIRIIYGGSINSQNVKEFLNQPTIDGVLIGGASLNPNEFVKIIKESL